MRDVQLVLLQLPLLLLHRDPLSLSLNSKKLPLPTKKFRSRVRVRMLRVCSQVLASVSKGAQAPWRQAKQAAVLRRNPFNFSGNVHVHVDRLQQE